MTETLRRLLVGLALAGYTSCSSGGGQPPPQPPAPPDPTPQCVEGQACACWHKPPEALGWLYACCQPGVPGGVVNVQDPAQCIAPPVEPPVPPVEPPVPPIPPTQPPATNCDGAPGALTGETTNTFGVAVNEEMRDLTGCSIGSDCRLGNTTSQQFLRAVIDKLRARGLCAGQHEPGVSDEIAVATNQQTVREGGHIFGGDDSNGPVPPGGVVRKVVWFPGAARPSYYGNAAPPIPPDPTPPPVAGCGNPLPPKVWTTATLPPGWGVEEIGKPRWTINCGPHQGNIDCVAVVNPHACDYCASIGMPLMPDGMQPRCGCPVRQEGSPERVPCETYLTGGTKLESRNGATCAFVNGNPFVFEPNNGNCRLCSVGDGRVCGDWF